MGEGIIVLRALRAGVAADSRYSAAHNAGWFTVGKDAMTAGAGRLRDRIDKRTLVEGRIVKARTAGVLRVGL